MQTKKTSMGNLSQTAFLCDLNALDAEQKRRYPEVLEQLQTSVQEVQELADGYAYQLVANVDTLSLIEEFIALERLCCPFLEFTLVSEYECGPVWLKLTGPEGVKELLRAEMEFDKDDKEHH